MLVLHTLRENPLFCRWRLGMIDRLVVLQNMTIILKLKRGPIYPLQLLDSTAIDKAYVARKQQ